MPTPAGLVDSTLSYHVRTVSEPVPGCEGRLGRSYPQARCKITQELGVRLRPARHGGWEIAGIDELGPDGARAFTVDDDHLYVNEDFFGDLVEIDIESGETQRTLPVLSPAVVAVDGA